MLARIGLGSLVTVVLLVACGPAPATDAGVGGGAGGATGGSTGGHAGGGAGGGSGGATGGGTGGGAVDAGAPDAGATTYGSGSYTIDGVTTDPAVAVCAPTARYYSVTGVSVHGGASVAVYFQKRPTTAGTYTCSTALSTLALGQSNLAAVSADYKSVYFCLGDSTTVSVDGGSFTVSFGPVKLHNLQDGGTVSATGLLSCP